MKFLNILFSISLLVSLISFNTGSNLKLKQPYIASGRCKSEWRYRNKHYYGCAKTPEETKPWCMVEGYNDNMWTWCDQPVNKGHYVASGTCKYEWQYHGKNYYGCDKTSDTQNSWCIVHKDTYELGQIQGDIWTWCQQKVQACS